MAEDLQVKYLKIVLRGLLPSECVFSVIAVRVDQIVYNDLSDT